MIDALPTQIVVPGTTTTAFLQQLLPNTDYNVGVVALYSDGEGPALNDAGKTCTGSGLPAFRSFPTISLIEPRLSLSAPQWPEEPPSVRPHHQHPDRQLGPRRRPSGAVPHHLRPHHRRPH